MFEFLRKGATSLFAKIFLAIIIIVFVFWGIGYFDTSSKEVVAEVNGEKINLQEFQEFYHYKYLQMKQTFGELSEEDLKQMKFKELVLQDLIQLKLLTALSKELGLKVTKEEVELALSQMPFFQEKGTFEPRKYQLFLRELGLRPSTFEELLKADLLKQKLQGLVLAPVLVSKDEVEEYGRFMKERVIFLEALLPLSSCESEVKVDEASLESYFNAHRDRYVEEERIKLAYYVLPIKGEVEVSEEEIKNYYMQNLNRFKEAFKVKLRRLLIPGEDSHALSKAQELKATLKTLKDFERYQVKKGEWFEGEALSPELREFLKKAKSGDILGPFKVSQGYLIVGVEEINPERVPKLEEVREQVLKELKKSKLRERTLSQANELYTRIVAENGLKRWAEKNGKSLQETNYLTLDELSKVVFSREVARHIFKHGKGEYFSPLEVGEAFYLLEVLDKKPKRNLNFSEARGLVLKDFLSEKGKAICEGKLKTLIERVKGEEDFEKQASLQGFQIQRKESLRKDLPLPLKGVGKPGLIKEPMTEPKEMKLYYILKLEETKEPLSKDEFQSFQRELLEWKREFVLKGLFEDYQKKAKIKVYPLFQKF